jgi:glycosyltransferase involved in cell wall biosynthesis
VSAATSAPELGDGRAHRTRMLLSVVVPVFNGGPDVVENVGVIRRAAAGALPPAAVELIVVSDGSLDGTAERLLAARSDVDMRVFHYERNLGKGYAVKLGSLAARGDWIALVDADLDLDPAAVPGFLEVARRDRLDFAIGSKRHPDSVVSYPAVRRIASWCYQQLNRVLFRLDVRDTQVGLKVFRREVAEQVMPLLLVKQFAFDLELLAVARSLGFVRVRELPIRLEYRFTGSGVGSAAVARALWDTAAVFYRLRILRTYNRKRRFLADPGRAEPPLVSFVGELPSALELDYPALEYVDDPDRGSGGLLALLAPGVRPAGNWLSAGVPYFSREAVAAVVVPLPAPASATVRELAASAVLESRLGGGSRRSSYLPGNVRLVADYPGDCLLVRRTDYLAAVGEGVGRADLVAWLARRGRLTVYTPDTIATVVPAPLYVQHLRTTLRHARSRGGAAAATSGRSLSVATALSTGPVVGALAGLALAAPVRTRRAGLILAGGYVALLGGSALLAALRFRSLRVALHVAPGLASTQAAYVAGFLRGLVAAQTEMPRRSTSGASNAGQSNRRA